MNIVKGILAVIIAIVLLIVINVICNINGINLPSYFGTIYAICAMLIYDSIKNRKNSEKES